MKATKQKEHLLNGCPTLVEVAMAYFGNYGQRTAMKHLKEYVNEKEGFSADLEEAGYVRWHPFFVPQQMIVIFKHMGPPNAAYEWIQGKSSRL